MERKASANLLTDVAVLLTDVAVGERLNVNC